LAALPAAPASAQRGKWDTRLIARIPAPGFPASAYPHPNGRVYVGTYVNPGGDTLPSRVFELDPDARRLVRSWVVPGQDLSAEHGIQAATSDAAGRLVLLDRTPARALILDPRTGAFSTYATFRDLAPCSGAPNGNCSPTAQNLPPMANFAAWGPRGELFVTDYQQGVLWRVPPGGGAAQVWLADKRLDGQMFGTTGIALEANRRSLLVAQGSSGGGGALTVTSGKLYRIPITGTGAPGGMTQIWETGPAEMPDGFGIARSGRIYVALLTANQIAVVGPNGDEIERFPSAPGGDNGSEAPFDSPSSAKFLGTRLMVPNQSYVAGDTANQTVLDVETGEAGLPEHVPAGAGGVDSVAPVLSRLRVKPSRVRRGRNFRLRLRLSEPAFLRVRIERRVGRRWRYQETYYRDGKTGANSFKLGARIRHGKRKRPMRAGRHRLLVRGTDAAGNKSRLGTRRLRVLR
jgi:sugar lactone lactonase YvrE